jgi:hypothetical protein
MSRILTALVGVGLSVFTRGGGIGLGVAMAF